MGPFRVGINSYLEETALHGFKYIGRSSNISKCYWILVVVSSTAFGSWLIGTGIIDWNEHPVVTTIDSIHTPIKDVQFPTITFCSNDHSIIDEWALTEHVFNFFEFSCPMDADDCTESRKLREDFHVFFEKLYDEADKKVEENDFWYYYSTPSTWSLEVNQTILAIQRNLTSLSALKEKLINGIGASSPLNFEFKYIAPLWQNPDEQLAACDDQCQLLGIQVSKFFQILNAFHYSLREPLFGTFLRKSSYIIGETFQTNYKMLEWSMCDGISDVEMKVHDLMIQLGLKMGFNVSLHDLPKFFKVAKANDISADYIPTFHPVVSYCKGDYNRSEKFIIGRSPSTGEPYNYKNTMPFCRFYWYNLKTERVHNPHNEFPDHYCANGAKNLPTTNLTSLLKVMKFAYHLTTAEDLKQLYDDLSTLNLPYNLKPFDQVVTDAYLSFTSRPYITPLATDKSQIQLAFTTHGLCFSWNAKSIDDVYNNSTYLKSIEEGLQLPIQNEASKMTVKGNYHKAVFVLNQWASVFPDRYGRQGHFLVGFSDSKSTTDMSEISAKKGKHTIVKVKPTGMTSDSDLLNLEIQKRKCRFDTELPGEKMTLYKKYSMASCTTECMLDVSETECHCIPWDMFNSKPDAGESKRCDTYGSACFFKEMNNDTKLDEFCSHCLPDCNSVQFTATQKEADIDLDVCLHLGIESETELYHPFNNTFQFHLICTETIANDVAIIEFQMEGKTFTTFKQSLRISDLEKLGSIGGSLGLFTGFSIIAVFELLYWILVTLLSMNNLRRRY